MRRSWMPLLSVAVCLAAFSPGRADEGFGTLEGETDTKQAAALLDLGRRLFNEPALSASGQMSCASCHNPAFGFTPSNAQPVQTGGRDGRQPGIRAVPTLKYLQEVKAFSLHYMGAEEDGAGDGVDQGPVGGLNWDGRVTRGRDQALIPLMSSFEMANTDAADLSRRALAAGYGPALAGIFGEQATADPKAVLDGITAALEAYEQDPPTFFPYSSKFDAFLSGKTELTEQERRGMAAFNDATRGNCASCHVDAIFQSGGHPDLTDFGMTALGVPRNPAIPANADPAWFDLGVCGPVRTDLRDHPELCGLFRTPTLRNAALKKSFFHNGYAHTLRQAVAIYADRDLDPAKWYGRDAAGAPKLYDDLPAQYRDNIERGAPFDRKPGEKPALTEADVDDITAFIETMTDGWTPPTPAKAAAR